MRRAVVRLPLLSFDPALTYIVVEMVDRPGVLAGITNALARLGVNIAEGLHSREARGRGVWIALVEVPGGVGEDEIVGAVEGVEGVLNVSLGGLRYGNVVLPPVELAWELVPGMPVSIWRHMFLTVLFQGLLQAMGPTAKAIYYHLGLEGGKLIYEFWRNAIGTGDPKTLIEGAFHILQRLGWFTHAEILELNPEKARITFRLKNSIETYERTSKEPLCYFLTGLFSGYLSKTLNKEIKLAETQCQAKGDPHCTFTTQTPYE